VTKAGTKVFPVRQAAEKRPFVSPSEGFESLSEVEIGQEQLRRWSGGTAGTTAGTPPGRS